MSSRALSELLADQYYHSMVAARRRGPVWSVTDLGELAVRLGSIVTFDRRGDVVWLDGFEEGLNKWVATTWGAGGAVGLDQNYARNGNWSCKLTAGSDGIRRASIYRKLPRPVVGNLGLECSFGFDSNLANFRLLFDLYDGAYRHEPLVTYDYVSTLLSVRDEGGAWQDVATGVDVYESYYPFWSMKLVVDFANQKYVRLIFNETEYDLSAYSYLYTVDASNALLRPGVQNNGIAAANAIVYLDDVIITQNEPEN